MNGIIKFDSRPRPSGPILAAKFDGSRESIEAIRQLAQREDADAVVEHAPGLDVLLVRHLEHYDDHPPRVDYEVIELNAWLGYSAGSGLLYATDDRDLETHYTRADS